MFKMNFIFRGILLVSIILFSDVLSEDEKTRNGLPSLWSRIRRDKSYHIMYQLYMVGNEEILVIEEWAEFSKQLFRLDTIANGVRTTYLADGRSKEFFRFKPFVCDQLKADSSELSTISSLFKGWNIGDEQETMMAFGLGPLWLRAEKDSISQQPVSTGNSGGTPLEGYTIYDIKLKQNDNAAPYNLRMYFRPEKGLFVDAVEWISVPSENDKVKNKQPIVVARVKLNKIDMMPIADSIFELPVGYGCIRSFEFDHPLEKRTGLEMLHQGGSNQAILDITLSKPINKVLHTWKSQKFTARLLRGSMKMIGQAHSYFVALTQSRDPNTSRIKRIKRVWAALDKSEQAAVYTIDQGTGKCRISHESCKDHIQFSLEPNLSGTPSNLKPFTISSDTIAALFEDYEHYHMLREGTEMNSDLDSDESSAGDGASIKDAMFEKRVSNFELNKDGLVIWSGPISIIKKVSSFTTFSEKLDAGTGGEFEPSFHTVMTILFYSQDFTELQYKVVVDLIDKDEVDINFMHKQLDISDCFSDQQKSDIIIKYPLESQDLAKKLFAIQDLIQEHFCLDLFESFPIQPIQVSGIETSFDNLYMYLKMTMHELPLTQMFELKRDKRLVKDGPSESLGLIEKMSPNVEKCASSCEHYNCYRFSYDAIELTCRISIVREQVEIEEAAKNELYEAVELKLGSDIWGYDDYSGGRSHIRPLEMVEMLKDLYENRGEHSDPDDNSLIPLSIRIEREVIPDMHVKDPEYIELVPASIHSDIDSMKEYFREENILLDGTGDTKGVIRAQDSSQLKVQYVIVYEEHCFKDNVPGTMLDDLSYEDCAQLCENLDCRSFSYCKYTRECHVTSLHKLSEIQSASNYNAKCVTFSLDYLSKFDNYGLVETPNVVRQIVMGSIASARDCAIYCMEESSFTCQGFYYCDKDQKNSSRRCLMQDKHLEETSSSISAHRPKFKASVSGDSSSASSIKQNNGACVFYSRSYLAHFDEYFEKNFKIPSEADNEDVSEVVVGLGAESCAQKCIQQSCTAFSVCLDNLGSLPAKHTCQLAKGQFKRSFVFYQPRCATYVLSDKSQFSSSQNRQILIMSDSKPNKEALLNERGDSKMAVVNPEQQADLEVDLGYRMLHMFTNINKSNLFDKSHWFSKLVSAVVGILIGVAGVAAWKDKDRLQDVVLGFVEELSNRVRRGR